jgi:hypothetical protein
MSYYMGDYYRGDPGFFSFLGGLAKKAAGFIPGVGPEVSSIAEKIIPSGSRAAAGMRGVASTAMKRVGSTIVKHPVLSAAGAAGALGALGGAGAEKLLTMGGACPRGHHISKSKHAKHFGQCVRNRRMNPCNGRALRRAIRRAHAFERIAKHVIGFSSPRKPKGHMYFKRRRKK